MAFSDNEANFSRYEKSDNLIYMNGNYNISIYKAINRETNEEMAWKEITCTKDNLERVTREGTMQRELAGAYVCPVIASGYSQERQQFKYMIIMNLIDSDLKREMDKRSAHNFPWTEGEIMSMAAMIVSVLSEAQRRGICHRDLKPPNIFLTNKGVIQLGDFGCARNEIVLGQNFTWQGTVSYMSPILRSNIGTGMMLRTRVSHNPYKSDVYSLGMTLFALASLREPDSILSLKELTDQIEALRYSLELKSLIKYMLTEAEADRPDFQKLSSKLTAALSNIRSEGIFFDEHSEICRQCRQNPEFICLCDPFNKFLCSRCAIDHARLSSNEHFQVSYQHRNLLNSTTKIDSVRERVDAIRKFQENIQVSIENAKSAKAELNNKIEDFIAKAVTIKEEKNRQFEEFMERMENLRMNLVSELEKQLCTINCNLYKKLREIQTPYFQCETILLPSKFSLQVNIMERLSQVESVTKPILLPIINSNNLFLFNPETDKFMQRLISNEVVIDGSTSFAFVNTGTLAASGGDTKAKQVFTLDFLRGTLRNLTETMCGRKLAGIIHIQDVIYIFGGLESGNSAESVSLLKNTAIPLNSSAYRRHAFNPCYYNAEIYLSGSAILESYSISNGRYRKIMDCSEEVTSAFLIIADESLFILRKNNSFSVNLKRGLARNQINWVQFEGWSNTAPLQVEADFYIFGENDGTKYIKGVNLASQSVFKKMSLKL